MQISVDLSAINSGSGEEHNVSTVLIDQEHDMSSVLMAPAVITTPSPSPSSETLVQLCRLWRHIHEAPAPTPPTFCGDVLRQFYRLHQQPASSGDMSLYDDRYRYQTHTHVLNSDDLMVGIDSMNELTFTGRSLSLLAVLGGVLFILLVVAFVTCIKHRKRVRDEESDGLSLDMISSQLRQMHQARASQHLLSMLSTLPELPPAPPPDYDTVCKQTAQKEEQDLPSYMEATGGLDTVDEEEGAGSPAADTQCTPNPVTAEL